MTFVGVGCIIAEIDKRYLSKYLVERVAVASKNRISDNTWLFFATIVIAIVALAFNIVLINWLDEDNRPIYSDGVNVETTTTFELSS